MAELTRDVVTAMVAEARQALTLAYAPYSRFPVGAAVLLADGTTYTGCNVENASFGLTVCAERVALFKAVSDGRLDIIAVAVATSAAAPAHPCGACRQVIAEFSQSASPIVIITACAVGEPVIQTISQLLPDTFTLL